MTYVLVKNKIQRFKMSWMEVWEKRVTSVGNPYEEQ